MHTRTAVAGLAGLALIPSAALAAKPVKPAPGALTLGVSATPITVPGAVTISGALTGVAPVAGVTVALEQDNTRPYGDSYKPVGATVLTTAGGAYAFTQRPLKNTQYRAVAKASPVVTSGPRLVNVRPFVGIKASTRTPVAGRTVRFSGLVKPARNGARVLLQRRSSTGGFVTVKTGLLRASSTSSVYTIAIRVSRSGAYRVKLPGTAELVNGFSRTLSITTH
jgi:hypothetical protein